MYWVERVERVDMVEKLRVLSVNNTPAPQQVQTSKPGVTGL